MSEREDSIRFWRGMILAIGISVPLWVVFALLVGWFLSYFLRGVLKC
ncbi:hypothetical protein [Leptospirillum ferriphilum]|nr:hypothetical protein [Leptospirillum ferriphilum]